MQVTVRLFAWLRDCAGTGDCRLTLEPDCTAADAKAALAEQFPELRASLAHARPSINWNYLPWETPLRDGDELAIIPPVSGG